MRKDKYQVRLTVATLGGKDSHGLPILGVRASTKVGAKELFVVSPTEAQAIEALKEKVAGFLEQGAFRAEYPKTVEVKL